jgi:PAS domain S-box-containing protein
MNNENSPKEELIDELVKLRHMMAEFEARGAKSQISERLIKEINLLKETLLRSGTLQEKLQRITDGLVNIFEADFARIWITKPGDRCGSGCVHAKVTEGPHVCRYRDRCLHLLASSGRYTHIDGEVHGRVPFGCYKIGRVAAGLEPKFLTNDVAHDARIHDRQWAKTLGLISFAGFRLVSEKGTPIGVMALFSKHELSADDSGLIDGMAMTAAQVLQTWMVEDALRQSEDMLSHILSAAPLGIAYVRRGKIRWANEAMAKIFGDEDEHGYINRDIKGFYASEKECKRVQRLSYLGLKEGKSAETEVQFRRKDGAIFWGQLRMSAVDKSDPKRGTITTISDITERKQAEDDLRVQTDRFQSLSENAPFGMVMIGKDGSFNYVNPKFQEILGYDLSDVPNGREWCRNAYPDPACRQEVISAWMKDVKEHEPGETRSKIFTVTCKDGGQKIIHFRSVQLVTGEDLMTLEDVTLAKRLEEKLLQMSKVFMESIDPIFIRDLEGHIVDLNKAAEQTYGWSREELLGKSFETLVPTDRHEKAEETHERCKRGEKVANVDALHRTESGEIVPVLISLSLLTNEKGESVGMATITKNLSDLKRTEEMLRSQTKALERSNKDLEEFAYVAAHDLREPLIGIAAYAKILQRKYSDRLDAPAHKLISRTLDTVNRMDCLIQSLLSYSRVGSEAQHLQPTDCNIALADALSNLRSAIEASGATVMSEPLPTVIANPSLLVQLFQNLVSNAIKFAGDEPLEICIGIQRQESEWRFSVKDNGVGIEPPHFDRIFRIFQRIESGVDRPGTGIGLANCKKIVEHHGGRIWVESRPEEGSTFFFTIPERVGACS